MKFKIDENLPAELVADLRAAGHEAETVPAQELAGAADSTLLAQVKRESRVLLTTACFLPGDPAASRFAWFVPIRREGESCAKVGLMAAGPRAPRSPGWWRSWPGPAASRRRAAPW